MNLANGKLIMEWWTLHHYVEVVLVAIRLTCTYVSAE